MTLAGSAEAAGLRRDAGSLADALPPLLAEARQLAAAIQTGEHGRRRAGVGEEFWQYRTARPEDEARRIDWRRSGRSDQFYIREKEWQAAQSVHLWVDRSASMNFRSTERWPEKGARARVLALAVAILLERAGERFGLADDRAPPRAGRAQLGRVAGILADEAALPEVEAAMGVTSFVSGARALVLSDFFGDIDRMSELVLAAAGRGVTGALMQIVDPAEEDFPFAGRTVFEMMSGAARHETQEAGGLRRRYIERLAERRDRLQALAAKAGWQFTIHRTDQPPMAALIWIHTILGGAR
ncbi:DUF58 domain-containing protein [Frigidibacter sp. RF13]|uniref:DUF58 domain-containing protein n=1 Tax=Frigidibacter sp. RF13 TaxID=2997340 RepID=UPI00226F07CF|nr:DUF58 domain-containing protein [Frigidibacter sp. RF13]MCY1126853.1 DUF58 domain-containing protein [Frigidibacter sp. RF13]